MFLQPEANFNQHWSCHYWWLSLPPRCLLLISDLLIGEDGGMSKWGKQKKLEALETLALSGFTCQTDTHPPLFLYQCATGSSSKVEGVQRVV